MANETKGYEVFRPGALPDNCDGCARRQEALDAAVDALRLTRGNLSTLNAARMDRGIVPFDSWLAVVEAAITKAEAA